MTSHVTKITGLVRFGSFHYMHISGKSYSKSTVIRHSNHLKSPKANLKHRTKSLQTGTAPFVEDFFRKLPCFKIERRELLKPEIPKHNPDIRVEQPICSFFGDSTQTVFALNHVHHPSPIWHPHTQLDGRAKGHRQGLSESAPRRRCPVPVQHMDSGCIWLHEVEELLLDS